MKSQSESFEKDCLEKVLTQRFHEVTNIIKPTKIQLFQMSIFAIRRPYENLGQRKEIGSQNAKRHPKRRKSMIRRCHFPLLGTQRGSSRPNPFNVMGRRGEGGVWRAKIDKMEFLSKGYFTGPERSLIFVIFT